MIMMDTPQDEEFKRKNANLLAQELDAEKKYESLKKHGLPCDGCGELFMYEELDQVSNDDDGIEHVCKDC